MSKAYAYIARTYGLTFEPGQRVTHDETGRSGEVRRERKSQSHYVMVRFDGDKHNLPCHPEALEISHA